MSNLGLLQIFLALYLAECVLRVPKGSQAYVRGLWGAFARHPAGWTLKALLPGGAALLAPLAHGWEKAPPSPDELERTAARLAALQGPLAWLNTLGLVLLGLVGLLVWVWRLGPGPGRAEVFLALFALALLCHGALVWGLGRAWRRVRPGERGRGLVMTTVALSPWASSRCADLLFREALGPSHPLAVGLALLPDAENEALAGDCLRRSLSGPAADAAAAEAWRGFMRGRGWKPEAALAPPERQPGSGAWCPCCRVQYRAAGRCHECSVPLRPY
jgi:hypothetical protein